MHCSNGLFVGDLFTISEQGVSGVSIYRVFTVKCEKSTVLKILTNSSNWRNVSKILKFEDLDVPSSFKTHKNNEKNWLARFVIEESEMLLFSMDKQGSACFSETITLGSVCLFMRNWPEVTNGTFRIYQI